MVLIYNAFVERKFDYISFFVSNEFLSRWDALRSDSHLKLFFLCLRQNRIRKIVVPFRLPSFFLLSFINSLKESNVGEQKERRSVSSQWNQKWDAVWFVGSILSKKKHRFVCFACDVKNQRYLINYGTAIK